MADPVSLRRKWRLPPGSNTRRQLEACSKLASHRPTARSPRAFHDLAAGFIRLSNSTSLVLSPRSRPERHAFHILEPYPHGKDAGTESPIEGHPSGWVWQRSSLWSSSMSTRNAIPDFMRRLREHMFVPWQFFPSPRTAPDRLDGASAVWCRSTSRTRAAIHAAASPARWPLPSIMPLISRSPRPINRNSHASATASRFFSKSQPPDTSRELPELFRGIVNTLSASFTTTTPPRAFSIPNRFAQIHALDFPATRISQPETLVPRDTSPAGRALATSQPDRTGSDSTVRHGNHPTLPPRLASRVLHPVDSPRTYSAPSTSRAAGFIRSSEDVELLQPVAAQIAIAVETLAFKEIEALKNKLAEEKPLS